MIGVGMDGGKTLTAEALKAIENSELLIGAERMLEPFRRLGKDMVCSYISHDIADVLNSCGRTSAAVLMSGDCSFFSGTKKLLPLLEGHETQVIPGISSLSYFCAKTGIPYEEMKPVSLHGRAANIAVNVKMNRHCFFLLGGDITAADVCRRLAGYGLGGVRVYIGEELGYPDERIVKGIAAELTAHRSGRLSVLITENPDSIGYIPSAVSDGQFVRGDIPMTKSEVRCIAVSKLGICRDSVVWDIGCGTGSVSVEAAYRCPDGRVLSYDKNPEAAVLTRENSRIFGCDNIEVYEGVCPDILADAPAPDKVFIGGSSGNIGAVFELIHEKNPGADIVVTAVSLETLDRAISEFDRFGGECETVQIAVTRTKKIGAHTMMQGQNPVFIISGRLK